MGGEGLARISGPLWGKLINMTLCRESGDVNNTHY